MEKNVKISLLFDFYKNLLTERQAESIDLYYNEDLSLAEIAEQDGLSRQGYNPSGRARQYQARRGRSA